MKRSDRPYTFKKKKDIELFVQLELQLQIIWLDLCKSCTFLGIPQPILTSTIRGRLPRSISDTHAEGRAIDFRSWIHTRDEIESLCRYINKKYAEDYGTGPNSETPPKCLIYEDIGVNSHLHLQIRSSL